MSAQLARDCPVEKGRAARAAGAGCSSCWTAPGEIEALIGGRDYGESQLNHVLARRQPGSAFKPFVYAAAFEGGVDGVQPIVTPATTVMDEPTTFDFDGKEYTPNNYGEKFRGQVTLQGSADIFAECCDGKGGRARWLYARDGHGAPVWARIRRFSRRLRWRSGLTNDAA